MPSAPKIVPLAPTHTPRPRGTTSERGYGHAHQKQRARLIALHPLCQRCGEDWSEHLHHKDRDPFNRAADNVEVICEHCHQVEHGARR
jgi:5-methylcytosine-specific restriction endonuclease McrA